MNKKQIKDEIEKLQARLAKFNRIPDDTFPFGTVVVIAAPLSKFYIIKKEEELWAPLRGPVGAGEKSLEEWIMSWIESDIGNFEAYVMITQPTPFFASE